MMWLCPWIKKKMLKMGHITLLFVVFITLMIGIVDSSGNAEDFYSFSVTESDGRTLPLDRYRGKVTLVVNVASECGFTDTHYRSLIRLRNIMSTTEKFEVLAFPCNQFGNQEPGTDEEIQKFVEDIYHVNFPVFAKVDVLGEDAPDAWKYLIKSFGSAPVWNFWKYLVDENGHVLTAWGPHTPVEDIFHDVKEVVDKIGDQKPHFPSHHQHSHSDEL